MSGCDQANAAEQLASIRLSPRVGESKPSRVAPCDALILLENPAPGGQGTAARSPTEDRACGTIGRANGIIAAA
jgi:hypothetical protein